MLRQCSLRLVFLALLIVATLSPTLWADIYEWEWVDPADPSQGKQQSTTLCPSGAGLVPVPWLYACKRDLTQAYLAGADLTNADFFGAKLTDADLAGANLTNADFYRATLTDADLTGATIAGARFRFGRRGLTRTQFESTASYVSGELTGIRLTQCKLSSWNFAGKNLTNADFGGATLTDANLAGTRLANAQFWGSKLNRANLTGANCVKADFTDAILTDADLTGANLTNADFDEAVLTNANLTGATITRGIFWEVTDRGFTQAQFESTASYASGELVGIVLGGNDLTSWNFAGKNLTNVCFAQATLTDANLTGATITGTCFYSTTDSGFTQAQFESTASYALGELNGIDLRNNDLSSWNFAGKDLTNANFSYSTLTDVDLTGAIIAGGNFWEATGRGFTKQQFESTASYKSGKLNRMNLGGNDLSSWNFAGKNLTDTSFPWTTLTDANLTGADARGARDMEYSDAAALDNFVQPDGRVEGLDVAAGESFRVWDFDGVNTDYDGEPDTMLGITVGEQFAVDADGLLIVGLEDEQWGSTIDFDAGIGVDFGGTLEIELRGDFLPMPGDQWQLFDFTGVTPMGGFDTYVLPSVANGQWDTSHLMSDGVLSFNAVPEPSAILLLATLLAVGIVPVKWRK